MKTLSLTSPPMRGKDVVRAQQLLNAYGAYAGIEDGVFGEQTARACSQAKYMLGYSLGSVRPTYGKLLDDYLSGRKKPGFRMRRRAAARRKKKSLGERAIEIGSKYIGVREHPPHSNRVMFSEWYGLIGPWCLMFVTYAFVTAGSKAFSRGSRWAYCPFAVNDARAGRYGTIVVPVDETDRGDVAYFSWRQNGVADHVGIVLSKPDASGNFDCLEGNTSLSHDSDGGEVMIRRRNNRQVLAYVRVAE